MDSILRNEWSGKELWNLKKLVFDHSLLMPECSEIAYLLKKNKDELLNMLKSPIKLPHYKKISKITSIGVFFEIGGKCNDGREGLDIVLEDGHIYCELLNGICVEALYFNNKEEYEENNPFVNKTNQLFNVRNMEITCN